MIVSPYLSLNSMNRITLGLISDDQFSIALDMGLVLVADIILWNR